MLEVCSIPAICFLFCLFAAQYDDGNIPDVDLPRGEDVVSPVVPMPGFTQPINTGIGEE